MNQPLLRSLMTGVIGLTLLVQPVRLRADSRSQSIRTSETPTAPPRQLSDVLNDLKERYTVDILYSDQLVQGLMVPGDVLNTKATLEQNLQAILRATGLNFRKVKNGAYLITGARSGRKLTEADPRTSPGGLTSGTQRLLSTPQSESGSVPALSSNSVLTSNQPAELPITGHVTDAEKGEDLLGVSVVVKGTATGTTTDARGNYTINVPDRTATLVFSFVGYASQSVTVINRNVLNVSLVLARAGPQ